MTELDYKVLWSRRRKKLTITVERDRSIVAHAPEGMSEEDVRRVVNSKRQWIIQKLRHPQKYIDRSHPPGKEVVSGEAVPYLGSDYRIEVTETLSGKVEFSDRFLVPPHVSRGREVLRDWYVAQSQATILPRAQKHARELGVEFKQAKIVDNRYQWGSCTVNKNIHFNWRLIKAPMFVIDYVIVHELAHLMQANHSADFWNIVRARTPTMDKAKTWLRQHGQVLEEDL